jgi:predicted RNase H-like HicB family nuclease
VCGAERRTLSASLLHLNIYDAPKARPAKRRTPSGAVCTPDAAYQLRWNCKTGVLQLAQMVEYLSRAGGQSVSREFSVVIEQDEDVYFVASVPALRGCHTQAKSLDDLVERVREAIELCLEAEGAPASGVRVRPRQGQPPPPAPPRWARCRSPRTQRRHHRAWVADADTRCLWPWARRCSSVYPYIHSMCRRRWSTAEPYRQTGRPIAAIRKKEMSHL